jgi:hypothetical protein
MDCSTDSTEPFNLLSNANENDKGLSKCDIAKMSHFYTTQSFRFILRISQTLIQPLRLVKIRQAMYIQTQH